MAYDPTKPESRSNVRLPSEGGYNPFRPFQRQANNVEVSPGLGPLTLDPMSAVVPGGKALDGSPYGPSIGGRDATVNYGWGTGDGAISDAERQAAQAYVTNLQRAGGSDTANMLQADLSRDPRLARALDPRGQPVASADAYLNGVDVGNGKRVPYAQYFTPVPQEIGDVTLPKPKVAPMPISPNVPPSGTDPFAPFGYPGGGALSISPDDPNGNLGGVPQAPGGVTDLGTAGENYSTAGAQPFAPASNGMGGGPASGPMAGGFQTASGMSGPRAGLRPIRRMGDQNNRRPTGAFQGTGAILAPGRLRPVRRNPNDPALAGATGGPSNAAY